MLRMKNFNTLGVHWKVRLLRGGISKNQYRGRRLPKKGTGGLVDPVGGLFSDLSVGWGDGVSKKERDDVFEWELRPQYTLWLSLCRWYKHYAFKSSQDFAKQINQDLLNLSHWPRANKMSLTVQGIELIICLTSL